MQIVIDIPEEIYESQRYAQYFGAWSVVLQKHFENGTVLPEHGRLIDANTLKSDGEITIGAGNYSAITRLQIDTAPTILEAWGNEE